MDIKPMARSCRSYLESIVLCPSVTLGLSCFNKRTGASSGQKSISMKVSTTLFQMLIFFAGIMMTLHVLCRFFRMKERRKIKRKMKKGKKWAWKSWRVRKFFIYNEERKLFFHRKDLLFFLFYGKIFVAPSVVGEAILRIRNAVKG